MHPRVPEQRHPVSRPLPGERRRVVVALVGRADPTAATRRSCSTPRSRRPATHVVRRLRRRPRAARRRRRAPASGHAAPDRHSTLDTAVGRRPAGSTLCANQVSAGSSSYGRGRHRRPSTSSPSRSQRSHQRAITGTRSRCGPGSDVAVDMWRPRPEQQPARRALRASAPRRCGTCCCGSRPPSRRPASSAPDPLVAPAAPTPAASTPSRAAPRATAPATARAGPPARASHRRHAVADQRRHRRQRVHRHHVRRVVDQVQQPQRPAHVVHVVGVAVVARVDRARPP